MSCTQETIHGIVEKQRGFFRTGATLPVEWRIEQLKKLKAGSEYTFVVRALINGKWTKITTTATATVKVKK